MKTSELRKQTSDQLRSSLMDLKKEQFNLRFRKSQGDTEMKLHRIREVRRSIARIKTLQSQAQEG